MSRTEDYLDELLHSVSKADDAETNMQASGKKRNKSRTVEDDFLSAFEQEILASEDSDDFLQQFERELDFGGRDFDESAVSGEDAAMQSDDIEPMVASEPFAEELPEDGDSIPNENIMGNNDIPESLDEILSGAKEKMDAPLTQDSDETGEQIGLEVPEMDGFSEGPGIDISTQEDSMDIMIDTMGDIPDVGEGAESGESAALEQRLGDLADATENLSSISELGDEFGLDEFDEEQPMMEENTLEAAEAPEEEADGKKKKKSRKERKLEKQKAKEAKEAGKEATGDKEQTFLQKLSRIVFGEEDEDEEEEVKVKGKKAAAKTAEGEDAGEGAESGEESAEKGKKGKKEKKPKEKKPKEKKPKKEKKKKEKKPKPPKPKKEKKPKEPDRTPPLPKLPVFLIFIMAGSLLALVLIGTNLVGYTNQFSEAGRYYESGNYTEAYRAVRGMEIKEKDQPVFEKYRILASVAGEYDSYQSFMELANYEMALDSLIRAVGRSEKYREDAALYECIGELEQLKAQAVSSLSGFGLDEARALELYGIREKKPYSIEVHDILINAGLVMEE